MYQTAYHQTQPTRVPLTWVPAFALLLGGVAASLATGAVAQYPCPDNDEYKCVHLVSAGDLQWASVSAPTGAKVARVIGAHEVVTWPSGAHLKQFLPRHVGWQGVVLSGTMSLTAQGKEPERLRPLTYYSTFRRQEVSAKCIGTAPCTFLSLSGAVDRLAAEKKDVVDVDRSGEYLHLVEVGEFRWKSVARGIEAPGEDDDSRVTPARVFGLTITYYPVKYAKGSGLPFADATPTKATMPTIGFVLSGTLKIAVDGYTERSLGPGSYFQIPRKTSYSSGCETAECIVMSSEPPPGQPDDRW